MRVLVLGVPRPRRLQRRVDGRVRHGVKAVQQRDEGAQEGAEHLRLVHDAHQVTQRRVVGQELLHVEHGAHRRQRQRRQRQAQLGKRGSHARLPAATQQATQRRRQRPPIPLQRTRAVRRAGGVV